MREAIAAAAGAFVGTATPGRRRYRQAALASGAALAAKGAGFASTLLTIPLTAPYLGAERFGLLMTISTIPLVLSFSDFGIGNGLLTELSAAYGRADRDRARTLVSSASFMLLVIACALSALVIPVILIAPWSKILNLHSPEAAREAPVSIAVFAACVLAGIPLGLPQRIQQAFQVGFIPNLWLLASNAATFGLLLLCVQRRISLPWFIGAVAGPQLMTSALSWVVELAGERAWLRPSWRSVNRHATLHVARSGLLIFSCQVSSALLLTAPVFLLGRMFDQTVVASYAVIQRVLSAFVVAASLVVTPLWPAYGEAFARGEHDWIKKTFVRSLLATLIIAGIPLFFGAVAGPELTRLFTSRTLTATRSMCAAAAVLCFCVSIRHTISMMVNGCGYLTRAAAAFPVSAALAAAALFMRPDHPAAILWWVAGAELFIIAILTGESVRVLGAPSGR